MGVGQLLGKLFGGDSGKGETPLRAYGKLPLYAEYRRLDVSPGAPTQYSHWLDQGRLAWKKSPTHKEHSATRHSHLLLRLPESKEMVVASLWDSRDSLGRVFPFSFFIVCPPEALGNTLLERWVSAQRLHNTFDGFHAELGTLGRGGDFYKYYQKRTLLPRPEDLEARTERLRGEARRLGAAEYFKQALESESLSAAAWFGGLTQRTERWRANPAIVADLALGAPLAAGLPRETQVAAWLDWLDGWLAKAGKAPSIMAPGGAARQAGMACVLARDLMPDDFQLLTADDVGFDFVTRLGGLPAGDNAAVPATAEPEGSLLDWLRQSAGPSRA